MSLKPAIGLSCLSVIASVCPASNGEQAVPIKFGVRVAPHDVIEISNFVLKFSGVSDLQGSKSPFSTTLLVIVTSYNNAALPLYRATCDEGITRGAE